MHCHCLLLVVTPGVKLVGVRALVFKVEQEPRDALASEVELVPEAAGVLVEVQTLLMKLVYEVAIELMAKVPVEVLALLVELVYGVALEPVTVGEVDLGEDWEPEIVGTLLVNF
ncbi:hypothetical protein F0562_013604 [Nyssa sinensis]|uniref:Uncharacterized protein n=1 Tax=Nyssa sinensis TaxID=561372 RepID=A0A5J4ZNV5_9ASTE|nr:hypothetical protein F0562_013604 [Nyssa sinensis]